MSFKIEITGHTVNKHNDKIKEIAEEAWQKVADLLNEGEAYPTLSGYSGDNTGNISLASPKVGVKEGQRQDTTEADRAATESEKEAQN